LAELVDALDSKSSGQPCGFDSHVRHHVRGKVKEKREKVKAKLFLFPLSSFLQLFGGFSMIALFWITFIVFVIVSALLVGSVLLQEPKQSGLGGLDGSSDFSTLGGVSGGLQRATIILSVVWGLLAIALNVIPR
jgi:protein translocase SecG subunit